MNTPLQLSISYVDVPCVTWLTFADQHEVARTFRIEWRNYKEYTTWANIMGGSRLYQFPEEPNRPNVVLTTINVQGEVIVEYFRVARDRLSYWIEEADRINTSTTGTYGTPGRPVLRALEALTTRQRRTGRRTAPRV